jgi:hypothetical protein
MHQPPIARLWKIRINGMSTSASAGTAAVAAARVAAALEN